MNQKGFLLAYRYGRQKSGSGLDVTEFFIKRWAALYPLYFASIIIGKIFKNRVDVNTCHSALMLIYFERHHRVLTFSIKDRTGSSSFFCSI